MWLRLFYYLRIFRSTAVLVAMVIEITLDMKYFLLVLCLAALGFANSFYIIARNDEEAEDLFTGNTIFYAAIYSWN